MGLERFNAGFLLHVLNEQSEHRKLDTNGIRSSMDRWWANCVRNSEERAWIALEIKKVRRGEGIFSRETYEGALQRRKNAGSLQVVTPLDNADSEEADGENDQ